MLITIIAICTATKRGAPTMNDSNEDRVDADRFVDVAGVPAAPAGSGVPAVRRGGETLTSWWEKDQQAVTDRQSQESVKKSWQLQ